MSYDNCCLCGETENLWECDSCGEYYCQLHWHETALGKNIECSSCERAREEEVMYTKGEWIVGRQEINRHIIYLSSDNQQFDPPIAIARFRRGSEDIVEAQANARRIVAAVNACQKVNPDNPLAVAESIQEMYEALKAVSLSEPYSGVYELAPETMQCVIQALAKAEGRE